MIWHPWAIAVPFDSTIPDEIVAAMLAAGHWVTDPEPTPFLVLSGAHPLALASLRTMFANAPLREADDLIDADEFLVEEADRAECERLLAQSPPTAVVWLRLIQISVGSDAARRELTSRYDQYRQAGMC